MVTPAAIGGSMAVMGATMLPSALPLLRLDFATARSTQHTGALALGYTAVWAGLGALVMPLAMMEASGPAVAAALGGAAVYQASPVSRRCLTRCRTPLARIVVGWRDGTAGGLVMGVRDGLWCAGCCAGLLVAVIALGAVNVWAMLVFGALAALQKVTPFGMAASLGIAVALGIGAVALL
jgi:predicted metal-binding membrane protein